MTAEPLPDRQVSDRQYVAAVLELLWPGHRPISRPSSRGLLMVPPERPRLVLPRRPARVAAAALRNYNTAAAGVRRGRVGAAVAALRCGAGALVPGGIEQGREGIEAELSAVLDREVYVGLYLGPPRAVQKPVLQVLDPHGTTLAFAKVAMNDHTERLIEHEAAVLGSLAAVTGALQVPRLLHEGSWRSHRLTVQEAIPGPGRSPVTAALRQAAEDALAATAPCERRRVAGSGFACRVLGRLPHLAGTRFGAQLRAATGAALELTGGTELLFGPGHGDWVPWNMTVHGDRLAVWDWEGFAPAVPCGFDELHWRINRAVAIDGVPPGRAVPEQIRRGTAVLADRVGGHDHARTTALWYVLDLATRYAVEGEDQLAGTPLSRLEEWLSPALEALTGAA